jgi:hypothetical protein
MTTKQLERLDAFACRSNVIWNARRTGKKTQANPAVPLERSAGTKGHLCPSSGRSVPVLSLGRTLERFIPSDQIPSPWRSIVANRIMLGASKPKTRVSAKTRAALTFMVEEGLTRAAAAVRAGITDNWLYSQLRRPEVLALRSQLMEVVRTSEASRTISRAAKLADSAESEHVRLQANSWLAGIDGLSPVQRSENLHLHQGAAPGLTINFIQPDPGEPVLIEQPVAPRLAGTQALPVRVPHPSQLKLGGDR